MESKQAQVNTGGTAAHRGAQSDPPYMITYVASPRARNLRVTLRPDCSITVTIPRRASKREVQEFVESRRTWIQKHLARLKQRRPKDLPAADLSALNLTQAQTELFTRLESFAKQHNLPYRRAAFRCQKSKWGSCCKTHRSISLNINMLTLPAHLQDYLMLHELTHLNHPNHSPAFWAELNRYCSGKAKSLSKELKDYPITLLRAQS